MAVQSQATIKTEVTCKLSFEEMDQLTLAAE